MFGRKCCKHIGESEFITSISIQTYVFKWKFENFPDWPDSFQVTSNEFKPAKDIVLYAKFERHIDASKAKKCYFKIISKENTSFEIEGQLSFLATTGKVFSKLKPTRFAFTDQNERVWRYIIYPEIIEEFSRSTEDQIVIFKCTMNFKELATENLNRLQLKCTMDPLPSIIENFKAMYVDSLYTDFSFLVNNNALRVHKAVLCARSPVFAKMLESPMEENEKDAIEITDIKLPTLKTFIEFLYTGKRPTDLNFDSWCMLYYTADKYDVASLRVTCADALLDRLDSENSCRVLSLANRHSDTQFVDDVLDFMQCNFDSVMETEAWFELTMSEPELTIKVMRLRVQKLKKSPTN